MRQKSSPPETPSERLSGRLQHGPMEQRHLVCSVVRLGHLRLRDLRTVQRQGRGRGVRRRSHHSCLAFHRLRFSSPG